MKSFLMEPRPLSEAIFSLVDTICMMKKLENQNV
jgi:hypothetical protein